MFVTLTFALAVGVASAVSPVASSSPDGLTRVAEDKGFAEAAEPGALQEEASPAPGYAFPGVSDERVATGLAGFAGTLLVFGLGFGLAWAVRRAGAAGKPA